MLKAKEEYLNYLKEQLVIATTMAEAIPATIEEKLKLLARMDNLRKEIYEIELDEEESQKAEENFQSSKRVDYTDYRLRGDKSC